VLEIDGSDLILCPGFIDMHAHSDLHLLSHPSHYLKVSQGIAFGVVGQDGIGYPPLVGIDHQSSDHLGFEKRGLNGEMALEYVRK
jgi:N-acyl-D-amino-acid deacylase